MEREGAYEHFVWPVYLPASEILRRKWNLPHSIEAALTASDNPANVAWVYSFFVIEASYRRVIATTDRQGALSSTHLVITH